MCYIKGENLIELNDDLFIGHGRHKHCYRYPNHPDLCLKLAFTKDGKVDLNRELAYLQRLKKSGTDYSMLPKYYGPVQTNLGEAHAYELIINADGSPSLTLEDYLQDDRLLEENFAMLAEKLKALKWEFRKNEIITMGLFSENILIQQTKDGYRLRIINDMGCAQIIPLPYYFHYFAQKKIQKRWNAFILHLKETFKKDKIL